MKQRNALRCAMAIAALGAVIAGCSNAEEQQEVIEGPEVTQPDDAAGVVAPLIVDSGDPVTLEVGRSIDVVTDDVTRVESSDTAVLTVSQPSDDGSASFNAGATAVAAGSATLSVYTGDSLAYEVAVTVGG